jgi:hypothetical protein
LRDVDIRDDDDDDDDNGDGEGEDEDEDDNRRPCRPRCRKQATHVVIARTVINRKKREHRDDRSMEMTADERQARAWPPRALFALLKGLASHRSSFQSSARRLLPSFILDSRGSCSA